MGSRLFSLYRGIGRQERNSRKMKLFAACGVIAACLCLWAVVVVMAVQWIRP